MVTERPPGLADRIFQDLRAEILSDALAPGDRLPPERQLAARYRTNRNTLREVLRRLAQSRLVTVRQGQGITVCDFRKTASIELFTAFIEHGRNDFEKMRALLELLPARTQLIEIAAGLAAQRADERDIARLSALTKDAIEAFEARDRRALSTAYHSWLDTLVDAARSLPVRWIANPFLEAAQRLVDRFPDLWLMEPSFPAYMLASMSSLEANDATGAVTACRAYFQRVDASISHVVSAVLNESERASNLHLSQTFAAVRTDSGPAKSRRRSRARRSKR